MAEEGERVRLHVYDLSQGLARQLSAAFLGKTIEAIWHTGVVVFGSEYYFGGGIQRSPAGSSPYGVPLRVVDLGYTQVPKELFEKFLEEVSPRYTANTYNLMQHNCNNFSEEVAQFLVGCGIPEDILRLPQEVMSSPMGGLIMPMIQSLETTLKNGGVPQVPHYVPSPGSFAGNQAQRSPAPTAAAAAPPACANPSVKGVPGLEVKPSASGALRKVKEKKPAAEPAVSMPKLEDGPSPGKAQPGAAVQDPLGDARARVQEEITREFADIMAAGSLSASEAAALAARRVMERYGPRLNLQTSQRVS